jgi:hypothetical protein
LSKKKSGKQTTGKRPIVNPEAAAPAEEAAAPSRDAATEAVMKVPTFESSEEVMKTDLKLEPVRIEEPPASSSDVYPAAPPSSADDKPILDEVVAAAPPPPPKAASGKRPAVSAASGKAALATGGDKAALGKAASGKAPAVALAPTKTTTSSRRAVAAPPPAAPRVATKGGIWVTCRECLEEWVIDPERAKAQETIACPICEHRAQAPNDDILHQIALYKGIEQKNATIALVSVTVAFLAMVLWMVLTTNPTRAENAAVMMGLPAVAFIALIATFAFTAKYENSRWETYF